MLDHIEKLTLNLIDTRLQPTEDAIKDLVGYEVDYIDIEYPDFRTKELMEYIGTLDRPVALEQKRGGDDTTNGENSLATMAKNVRLKSENQPPDS